MDVVETADKNQDCEFTGAAVMDPGAKRSLALGIFRRT
jgi:hypothetical protein